MDQKVLKFLGKHKLKFSDILYLERKDNKTVLTTIDHTTFETYIPLKYLLDGLPSGCFIHINKGIAVAVEAIARIDGNVYWMNDGQSFTGRARSIGQHNANRQLLENAVTPNNHLISETMFQKFSVMDKLPLAFCVVEMIFNSVGHTVDFTYRYCNDAMEQRERLSKAELLNHSYYDIYAHGDSKWLTIFTDVAVNGTPHMVRDYDAYNKVNITLYCYQPVKNFCASILIEDGQSFPNITLEKV